MTPVEVEATLAADARLLVPVGVCEQHGPHLPLGVDTLIVERLADDLSAALGILRAPTLEYGVNAPVRHPRLGNAGVRKKTLHRLLNDLLASWEGCGVEEFVLLTAHRYDPHQEALATVTTTAARVRVVDVFGVQVADLLEGQHEAMHGDEVDTSLMLHLAPALVHMERATDYMVEREALRRFRRGERRAPDPSSGVLGRPLLASADKGRRLYERLYTRIAERVLGAVVQRAEG